MWPSGYLREFKVHVEKLSVFLCKEVVTKRLHKLYICYNDEVSATNGKVVYSALYMKRSIS